LLPLHDVAFHGFLPRARRFADRRERLRASAADADDRARRLAASERLMLTTASALMRERRSVQVAFGFRKSADGYRV
jgi:hypothetical protein